MTGTEGASATLPCVFTRPPQSLTAHTVTWMRKDPYQLIVTFRCIRTGSWAAENGVTRYELVEDPELGNAWIRIKQLRVEDSHSYLCLAEFRKGNHDYSSYGNHVKPPFIHVIQSEIQLQVTPAPSESVSVMTGTEGASATLPCVFTRPPQNLTAHTVTWMRKDPYRHIVTFRHQGNGSWAVENSATRYELIGDPNLGNSSTRIKQLRVEDSHSYLCLAGFRESKHDYSSNRDSTKPQYIHVFQSEIQLQVTPGTGASETVLMLCIPLGLKTLALLVMGAVLYGDKLRKRQD
ncbi:sialic acid-binding Ig-like lectin 15 [Hemitrygon akajei]|uniref:sialic acid-binding Ig-like lectin 15 n=1 Tax=Hemitrygon akajei TaxID=2704970 RepID=UPI003BF9CE14